MPVYFNGQELAFADLTAKLAKVTAERDRAREIAVALEQEVAGLRFGIGEALTLATHATWSYPHMVQQMQVVLHKAAATTRGDVA